MPGAFYYNPNPVSATGSSGPPRTRQTRNDYSKNDRSISNALKHGINVPQSNSTTKKTKLINQFYTPLVFEEWANSSQDGAATVSGISGKQVKESVLSKHNRGSRFTEDKQMWR